MSRYATGRSWSVSQGRDDLVTQLKDLKPAGVITESTGGLELPLRLWPRHRCHSRRHFAKSTGQLAKTAGSHEQSTGDPSTC